MSADDDINRPVGQPIAHRHGVLGRNQARDLREVAQTAGTRIDHAIAGIESVLAEDGSP